MMTILDRILTYKHEEVRQAKADTPASALLTLARDAGPTRGFAHAIARRTDRPALIAEVKKASPSKGLIRADFDPPAIARAYERGGADCLSVLTDGPSFQGSPCYLRQVRAVTALPILRKDFLIDPYQVLEARAWGADCILLILAAIDDRLAAELAAAAAEHGLDVLWETHDVDELDRAQALGASLIGVNNRNLKTFVTDLSATERAAARAPAGALLISESGLETPADIARVAAAGAKGVLVGEALMRADDVEAATRALITPARRS